VGSIGPGGVQNKRAIHRDLAPQGGGAIAGSGCADCNHIGPRVQSG